jgi:tetratricopeptide (TPR) repeat protein
MTTEPTPAGSTSTNITEQPAAPLSAGGASTDITSNPPAPLPSAAAASPPPQPTNWPFKADLLLLGLLLILSFFVASFAAANSDLWLHLAIGKGLSEGTLKPDGVDPYSVATEATETKPAVIWVHHSWLFSWLVYQLYNLVGGAGLVFGKALLFTGAIGLLYRIGWNEGNRWFVIICLVLAVLAASTRLLMQPIVVSLLFLSITLFILDRAGVFAHGRGQSASACMRCLWWLPPLFALWANLDSWFILGPLLLALCWAAVGIARWFPNPNPVPGKTIGAVLGVGLLACLVNPYHVRVFQLPPELAYLVLAVSDPLGIRLPGALVAGGRTLKEFVRIDANFGWAISSLSSNYWSNANLGMHIAGIAFYPLLLLGLLSFMLTALVKPQENAPTLQVSRFLLWLAFAVMALALHRMIPFFVLIAAPLTAMTLGEFLVWQQTSNAVSAERRDRGLQLARLMSVPFLLLLLYLAWPGWLHGTTEFHSPRRVAWELRPDPSMKQAAQTLRELQENGNCRVFNGSMELANYLPWFAPGAKYFLDTRLALYPGQSAAFHKARAALADPHLPTDDWHLLFKERNLNQVVMVNFKTKEFVRNLLRWWLDADQWRQRYVDQRMMVLSWALPDKTWPYDTPSTDMNVQAFGPVPADKRPPAQGAPQPQTPSFWTLYLEGVAPVPVEVGECKLRQVRFMVTGELMREHFRTLGMVMMTASLSMPGSVIAMPVALDFQLRAPRMVPARDFGPPALPILMVRAARQAVARQPQDADSHVVLFAANDTVRNFQEDHWIRHQRSARNPHPAYLRDRMRQIQAITTAYDIVQLQPDEPDHHLRLAELYHQQNLLDAALEHVQLAEKAFESLLNSGRNAPKDPKVREASLKQFRAKNVEWLEKSVRLRQAQFKENSAAHKPLKKAALALNDSFKEVREAGIEESPLGLGKKALEILLAIDPETLEKREQLAYLVMRLELLTSLGHADIVAGHLKQEDVRNALPPILYAQYRLFAGGALGDYEAMDEALGAFEAEIRQGVKAKAVEVDVRQSLCAPSLFLVPTNHTTSNLVGGAMLTLESFLNLNGSIGQRNKMNHDLFNTLTLRGIAALESGDTKRARAIFQATLDEAGNTHYFSDRPIARRYLDLLEEQWR